MELKYLIRRASSLCRWRWGSARQETYLACWTGKQATRRWESSSWKASTGTNDNLMTVILKTILPIITTLESQPPYRSAPAGDFDVLSLSGCTLLFQSGVLSPSFLLTHPKKTSAHPTAGWATSSAKPGSTTAFAFPLLKRCCLFRPHSYRTA